MAVEVIRPPADDEWKRQASNLINKLVSNIPANSVAADVAALRSDFNALLVVLRGLNVR